MRNQLDQLAEPSYKAFTERLVETKYEILGVRIPTLRLLTKELVSGSWEVFIQKPKTTFEEIMLEGFVIANVDVSIEQRLILIATFIRKIDNWSVCDSFCSSLKITKKYLAEMWNFLMSLRKERNPYVLRFIIVMMLMYYLSDEWIDRVLCELQAVHHDDYYVKMAVAWAISIAFIKQEEKTRLFLQTVNLDHFTFNKALQKIIESRQVRDEIKNEVRQWKRVK